MTSLGVLAGVRYSDLFGGDSPVVYMQKLTAARQPKRASEADRHFAQCMTEQNAWMEEARLGMLQRIETRQAALADQAYSPERNRRLDRLEHARMLLYPKIGANDD